MILRDAQQQDFVSFYGRVPEQIIPVALAAVEEGETLWIGGVYLGGDVLVAFTEMKPGMRSRKKQIVKAFRELAKRVRELGEDIYAIASPAEGLAEKLMTTFAFEKTEHFSEYGIVFKLRI